MARFRFSVILLCVLWPPLAYVATVQLLEAYAAGRFQAGLEAAYLGDIAPLLDGTRRIQGAVNRNVESYLARSRWIRWGARATVTVRTEGGTLLYPLRELPGRGPDGLGRPAWEVAAENFRLLEDNPAVSVVFRLPHNAPLTNVLLTLHVLTAAGLLYRYYRRWKRRYDREQARQASTRQALAEKGRRYERQLEEMASERERLSREVAQVREKLDHAARQAADSEEELLEEMIALEAEVAQKEALQARQQAGMAELQEKIAQLEAQLKSEQARKSRAADSVQKRFSTLYKNLEIGERAVQGYLDLTEEMKIKCEEVIHQLDADPAKVVIKRKVFGKKNRETVFEVAFGYRGRLYFLPKDSRKNALLVIGTKNSQQQDLDYLNRL